MGYRSLLRNINLQKKIDCYGAVVSSFLSIQNIEWLVNIIENNNFFVDKNKYGELQLILNQKFQSKIEYRCINCSPLEFDFVFGISPKDGFILSESFTDEKKYPSLLFLVPLTLNASKPLVFHYLAKSHTLNSYIRASNMPCCFNEDKDFVLQNWSKLTLNLGEMVVLYPNIPFSFKDNQPWLKIKVLPYEAVAMTYERVYIKDQEFIQPYELPAENFHHFRYDGLSTKGIKALRQVPITINSLTSTQKQYLRLRSFRQNLLKKIFYNK
ncbi:MAG: hypothetical protein U0V74_15705 [Chitinophagales bacterium]